VFTFLVRSSGRGIDEEDMRTAVGEFNMSHKNCAQFYGCKGEALASIAQCCRVEIISKSITSAVSISKQLYGPRRISTASDITCGTIVNVRDIFYNLPVRRTSLRSGSEIGKIKELIKKMSILHHGVEFLLWNRGSGKPLFRQLSADSVLSRLELLYSSEVTADMKVTPKHDVYLQRVHFRL
jgi:DNA mismatch repair ATPase MutL